MTENEISYKVRGVIFNLYNELGPGLLEKAYEMALAHELREVGLQVRTQVGLPFVYKDQKLDVGYKIDILVNEKVILELKSVETLVDVHYKQLLTYLKLSECKLGLLVNFNTSKIDQNIKRIVNNL